MTTKTLPEVRAGMQRIYRRFERWRKSHRGRLPIPEALWAVAAEVAREHGTYRIAKALRLEHNKLKRMVKSAKPAVRRTPAPPPAGFLELVAPLSSGPGLTECVIELEGPRGKMRIQWKGAAAPDLAGLSRALWESAWSRSHRRCASWWRSSRPMAGRASIRSPGCARTNSGQIPSRDACLYSGAVAGPRSVSWSMTARLAQKRLSQGRFVWWPTRPF